MKTIILGMNNPYSGDPRYALYPHPERSAGFRLCSMFLTVATMQGLCVDKMDYIGGFDRRNLINTPTWDSTSARVYGKLFLEKETQRRVIICGTAVLTALGLERKDWMEWNFHKGLNYTLIPHPSGLCREYNDPIMVERAGEVLVEEWKRANADTRT